MTDFGPRLRTLRLTHGITVATASRSAEVSETTWRCWESGRKTPKLTRAQAIASAIGVPIAGLFLDARVVADVVISEETVEDCRKRGRIAAQDAAQRLAAQLEPAIWDAATRKPADTRPGARAKPRRTRAELLAQFTADRKAHRRPRSVE